MSGVDGAPGTRFIDFIDFIDFDGSPAPPPARSGATSAAEDAIARGGDGVPAVGLEGANPALKLKMLASTSRAERLATATSELERQRAELAAKASLKSLGLKWGDEGDAEPAV